MASFCEAISGPFCGALFACCTLQDALDFYGGTLDACTSQFKANCMNPDNLGVIKSVLEEKATVLDEARLDACVSTLKAMAAGGNSCARPPLFVVITDCVGAFRGTAPLGGACPEDGDLGFIGCDNGNCIDGVCVPFVAEGEACDPSNDEGGACDFVDGQGCVGAPGMTKCGPQAEVGADCSPSSDPTFSCRSMNCGPSATCIPPAQDGLCEIF
jgi:hypothetical protein